MAHAQYIHLHVHSAYSLAEGALQIEALAKLCQLHDMPAVAITDTGNMFGALEFSLACAEAGIQPIVGTSLAVRAGEHGDSENPANVAAASEYLVLLAQDETGYRNLIKLSSRSHLDSPKGEPPHLLLSELEGSTDGIIALTGGASGPVDGLIGKGQLDRAEGLLQQLESLFPNRLFVELQRYGAGPGPNEEALLRLAYRHNLPIVATNEAFFADVDMYEAHDALICVAEGTYVSQADRRRLSEDHRFKTPQEMIDLFADLPEAISNTLVIAKRCFFAAHERDPILPRFPTENGRTEADELRTLASEGLEARLQDHVYGDEMDEDEREEFAKPYFKRLESELKIIIDMDYPGYFLIVADFIRWAKGHAIPVGPGRGSGAGSVAAWALTITDLDPLHFGLLFERFLNPDRMSMPDFDIDFCQDRRDEVIHYVQDKYGNDRVAQIITFGKLQARAAIRDIGRVLQVPYGVVDRLSKLVPNDPANPTRLKDAIKSDPRFAEIRKEEDGVEKLLDIAQKVEGLYRHASTHAAGIVIGDRPLSELVPLYQDPRSDMAATQFSMKYAERAGLVKFDFLGLKTLTVIDHTLAFLRDRGVEIDIAQIPLDDEMTYRMLQRAETIGVFQFESGGMRDLLREAVPSNIEDLIALVALFRPGPMENIPKYVACKNGRDTPEFLHETIEPVVRDTYGIIIYQEQVMQVAQVFAGFTLARADVLRNAMGKKIQSEMTKLRAGFIEGAVERGVDSERAEQVFDIVDKFAGYGFNKAHSAGYALVAYQTAWLKANYPVEFIAASMTLDLNNTDKLATFREELKRLKISMLPPDINKSHADFAVEQDAEGKGAVRYALAALKNVGRQAMKALVLDRDAEGPFKSIDDFADRVDPKNLNKRQVENLARSGAFDSLEPNRASVLAAAEFIMRSATKAAESRATGQASLFGESTAPQTSIIRLDAEMWSQMDLLRQEFNAMGTYISAHPLESYKLSLERLGVVTHAEAVAEAGHTPKRFKLAGAVLGRQIRRSAKGNPFAFAKLSDSSGAYEITVFSEALAASRDLLESGNAILVSVEAKREDSGDVRFTAHSIKSLDIAAASAAKGLDIFLASVAEPDEKDLGVLKSRLKDAGQGKGEVHIHIQIPEAGREVEIGLPGGFSISPGLREQLERSPGVARLRDI